MRIGVGQIVTRTHPYKWRILRMILFAFAMTISIGYFLYPRISSGGSQSNFCSKKNAGKAATNRHRDPSEGLKVSRASKQANRNLLFAGQWLSIPTDYRTIDRCASLRLESYCTLSLTESERTGLMDKFKRSRSTRQHNHLMIDHQLPTTTCTQPSKKMTHNE